MVKYTPVGAPWDGWDKVHVREKDGAVFDAIQSIVHLTKWLSVQLKLQLHLSVTHTESLDALMTVLHSSEGCVS